MQTIRSTFIDKTVLIHIRDGRAFKGTFVCVDDSSNVILANSEEFKTMVADPETSSAEDRQQLNPSHLQQRWVGMVMVKGQDIEKLEIQAGNWDKSGLPPSPSTNSNLQPIPPPGWPSDPSLYM